MLLTDSKQSFFLMHTNSERDYLIEGAVTFSDEWEQDVLLVIGADNVHESSRKCHLEQALLKTLCVLPSLAVGQLLSVF